MPWTEHKVLQIDIADVLTIRKKNNNEGQKLLLSKKRKFLSFLRKGAYMRHPET